MAQFDDKAVLRDICESQKHLTDIYNRCSAASTDRVAGQMLIDLLQEEHDMQFEAFEAMQKRGWCSIQSAKEQNVQETLQKFKREKSQI